jgi:hypothetical protein
MAKLFKLTDETENLISKVATEFGLTNYVNIKCFGVGKQKQVIKVKKASPTEEGMGNTTDSVIVIVAEDVFIRLTDEQQELLVRDALSQVFYDTEKDKIIVIQPEVTVTLGGWQKWGEKLIATQETAILARQQMEEEERERKAAEKESKKSKKNG